MTCSNCNGACYSPQACQLPERDRTFHPTYEIDGPHRRVRRSRIAVRIGAAIIIFITLLLIARYFGV